MTREEVDAVASIGAAVALLDVRTPEEFATGSVPGARNVPVEQLADEIARFPEGALIVTICNHGGQRSQGAARSLRDRGLDATHLVGGAKGLRPGH